MRAPVRPSLVVALGLGCAPAARPPAPPEPAPVAVVEAAPPEPAIVVREVPPAAFVDRDRRRKIDALLPALREQIAQLVAADGLVGVAVGVVVDGELVLGEGFGVRHAERGGAVDIHTAFRIGSITKIFTTMTALRLAQDDKLRLDEPAAAQLPELHRLVYPSADARRLTVRDILTHTAGLPRDPDLPPLAVERAPTRAELMQAIDGLSLVRPPGVESEYSNLGFSLLGHIIAAASGRPYHDAIGDAILAPLGMRRTVWEARDVAPEQLATGHVVTDGRVVVTTPTQHGALDAAGGLFSTVDDLARFVAFQLDAWPPRGDDGRAPLARTTLREAQRLQAFRAFRASTVPVELAEGGVEGGVGGVGWTWSVTHGCDHPYIVSHNGGVDGYHASVRMLPHDGIGVIVLANSGWADTDHIAAEILRALDRGGALARRVPQALPELSGAAARVVDLFAAWDEAAFAELSTHGLRGAAGQLAARMRWLHEALGACTLGPLKQPTNAWSGVYPLTCERGRAELTLSLTTARAPKIAGVQIGWLDGTPAPEVLDAAAAAVALLERFDEPTLRVRFSLTFSRAAVERLATLVRFRHGACRLDRALEVQGPDAATFALVCDRGGAKMSLGLDRGQPARIASFRVVSTGLPAGCR